MTKTIYKNLAFTLVLTLALVCQGIGQPANPWQKYISAKQSQATSRSTSQYYLIKIPGDVTTYTLKASGVTIIRKLDKNYAIAQIKQLTTGRQILTDAWPANNEWKLSPAIDRVDTEKTGIYLRSLDATQTEQLLQSLDLNFTKYRNRSFLVFADKQVINDHLLQAREVIYIGIESNSPTTDFKVRDLNLNPNKVNLIHNLHPTLNGKDITVSIQEGKYDVEDNDIIGRNVPSALSSENQTNHATSMATIIAGAGNSFVTGRGVAQAALITSSGFDDELFAIPDADEDYISLDVSVQNHSYGDSIENFYGVKAEAFDLSANNNLTLLHVMSSGNTGLEKDEYFSYKGVNSFASLSGNYKMSKNSLIVGSVDTVGRPVSPASKGPAYDGRVKPEVVTYSVRGTSNSSALVSGTTALLQQQHLDVHGTLPESALIKALLINSAKDVHNKAVDYYTGFGNVDAYRALTNLIDGNYLSETVDNGGNKQFDISVPANAENLKVTIVWNDPAALPNTNIALVNDLDMEVSGDGNTWLPWVLDPTVDSTALAQEAVRGEDHLNNVEQVTIDTPVAGNYTITVSGHDIPDGPQKFYVAYQWDTKDQFSWTFPTSSDNMPYNGETESYFRWESSLATGTGSLEYSVDDGTTWEVLSDNIDLSTGHFRWMPPEINTSAIARMVVDGDNYQTEKFSISRALRITVGFNCADSTLIQWDKSPLATSYDVFTIGDKYLEKVVNTSDTSFIIDKSVFEKRFFTIQPVLDDDHKLIKSYIIDYDLQGTGCYLISFFPEVTENQELFLNLELGTNYGVDEIIFERKVDDEFETVTTITPEDRIVRVQETAPQQGPNIHRAIIKFGNGEELITEETSIYYLTETAFMVFPNPLTTSDELKVYSKSFETGTQVTFTLYNRTGKMVRKQSVISDREFIRMDGLQPGLYLYRITANGEETTGRVVITE